MSFFEDVAEQLPASPILKWVGGKQRLIPSIVPKYISHGLLSKDQTYFEPFMGSGAIGFYCNFPNMVFGDKNEKLINFYREVRDRTDKLHRKIQKCVDEYDESENKEACYYRLRSEFNSVKPNGYNKIRWAALFWVLNKTCFNGMYRETKSGHFNIPYGKRNSPRPKTANFKKIANILQTSQLIYDDFEGTCKTAKDGDLVYFDPPYLPLSATSSFSTYLKDGFGGAEHEKLKTFIENLHSKNVKVVLSNSNSPVTKEIYGSMNGFTTKHIEARRLVSGKTIGRTMVKEVIITNIVK